ncbi:ABC transporter permease [Elusimicrobiota bacterium]
MIDHTILQTVRISIPYVLTAIGATFSERSGIINISLEGIMLNGAFCTVVGTYYTGSAWCGLISGVLGGILTSLIHSISCIEYKVNHIVSGIAVNFLSAGLTKFLLIMIFESSSNSERIGSMETLQLSVFGEINPLILITIGIIIFSHILLFKTRFGLRLRSCGENPKAAAAAGVNVRFFRYTGVLLSGGLGGLAGAWLAMEQSQFTAGMSNGRGYIALAAMILGRWTPIGAAAAGLLFGFAESMQIQMQTMGVRIPSQFIQMIPYLLTIVVLTGVVGRSEAPSSLGKNYPE